MGRSRSKSSLFLSSWFGKVKVKKLTLLSSFVWEGQGEVDRFIVQFVWEGHGQEARFIVHFVWEGQGQVPFASFSSLFGKVELHVFDFPVCLVITVSLYLVARYLV